MEEQMNFEFKDEEFEKKKRMLENFKVTFEETGDPFVDAGGMALEYISKQFPEKTIMELIEWAAKVYVVKWNAKLNALFLNSPITQTSKKGNQKILSTIEMFKEIITKSSNLGFCRYCGNKTYLSKAGRDVSCLVGSGTFVNFHHSHEAGLMICPQCAVKYFFLPFGLLSMGNLTILQSTTNYGTEFWKMKTVKTNLDKISRGTSEGILKSDFKNPKNALFKLASELINIFANKEISENLTLYHFTNFAASVDCNIYSIPNPVFNFLSRVLKIKARQWFDFTYRYYHISKSKWNEKTNQWEIKDKIVTEDDYRNCRNEIFNKLLEGRSILSNMTSYYKKQIKKTKGIDSSMAVYYAKEVIKMTSEQINLIKSIGNKIFDLMKEEDAFKKYLVKLEGASKAYQLRSALINIIKKNYSVGNEETIVTLDEWVTYLFPDGQYWGEVRDLLLIFLYEKMHENDMKIEVDVNEQIDETEENNEEI